MGIYVAIVAIIAWALVSMQSIRSKSGAGAAELRQEMERLTRTLAEAEAERTRLTERVQNLEAIVTTEAYDLLREDPKQAAARIELPEDDAEANPEERAARLARRMRT